MLKEKNNAIKEPKKNLMKRKPQMLFIQYWKNDRLQEHREVNQGVIYQWSDYVVVCIPCYVHMIPLFHELHWLSVCFQIQIKNDYIVIIYIVNMA